MMLKFRYKSLRIAAALMAGLAVPAAVAAPAMAGVAVPAAAAAPAATAALPEPAAVVHPAPAHLQNALLTAADLPPGYSPNAGGSTALVAGLSTDTNICDHQVSHGQVRTAQAAFVRGIPGPMLFETLSATGPRTARAIVAGIAAAPRLCRNFNDAGGAAILRLYPMRAPRLGDASAGLAFTVRPAAVTMTIHGRLVAVARRGVTVTIVLVNSPRNDQRELNLIAAGAIRKLDRVL
jgi:hypothetical protein